jgi:hypothetical protein
VAMKMKAEHFEALRAAIAPLDTPARREAYLSGRFPRAELVKDLDKRYRWDLLWGTTGSERVGFWSDLYAYLNDDHIDTALRSIVPKLETAAA